jgi:hypothetical protein
MFRVVHAFADLTDNNHVYKVGDEFPREGAEVSKERAAELKSSNNKIGKPLIVAARKKKEQKK